jgi:hypothetical protein
MNRGLNGFGRQSNWKFRSEPQPFSSGTSTTFTFYTGAERPVHHVTIRLLCVVANNGYVVGDEVPIDLLVDIGTGDSDGRPKFTWQVNGSKITVIIWHAGASSIRLPDTSDTMVNFVETEWKLICLATA